MQFKELLHFAFRRIRDLCEIAFRRDRNDFERSSPVRFAEGIPLTLKRRGEDSRTKVTAVILTVELILVVFLGKNNVDQPFFKGAASHFVLAQSIEVGFFGFKTASDEIANFAVRHNKSHLFRQPGFDPVREDHIVRESAEIGVEDHINSPLLLTDRLKLSLRHFSEFGSQNGLVAGNEIPVELLKGRNEHKRKHRQNPEDSEQRFLIPAKNAKS